MGKSSSPPPAPDPYAVAGAQTDQNRDTAEYNAALNRVNTYTPWGSQTYNVTGRDSATGAPIYEQNIELSPEQQQLLDAQMQQNLQLTGLGGDVIAGMTGTPLDTSKLPGLPGAQGYDALRSTTQDALYDRNAAYLDQRYGRDEDATRTRLANQGVVEGSEAYSNAMDDFNRGKEMAYRQARNEAIIGSGAEAERGSRIDSGTRNQMLSEMLALRNQPLNEFNAYRSGSQVNLPQFQGMYNAGTNPADIAGPMYDQYQGQLSSWNADQQSRNSLMNNLFGLGASALMLSDENAKDNIVEIGELKDGTNLYAYTYKGDDTPQVGVMAQEVEKTNPDAVIDGDDGFKRVNYNKVLARALA